jgi:ubiquinone/menaquinone biosynthesis C-methylase UbiE
VTQEAHELVERSVRAYERASRRYERHHPEIFNDVEQGRLKDALGRALAAVRSAEGREPLVLDFGCGTGNLTRLLLGLEARVLAADVSPEFLRIVERRFGSTGRVQTMRLNGVDMEELGDGSVDMVAAYSVLHHVPDYVAIVDEMQRVLRPGGVVFVDHEVTEAWWDKDSCAERFKIAVREAQLNRPGLWNPARRRWQRALVPRNYVERWRRWRDPGYPLNAEGDIHVWAWDHIEWPLIRASLERRGSQILLEEDYLHYSADFPRELWQRHAASCSDMRLLVARTAT